MCVCECVRACVCVCANACVRAYVCVAVCLLYSVQCCSALEGLARPNVANARCGKAGQHSMGFRQQ